MFSSLYYCLCTELTSLRHLSVYLSMQVQINSTKCNEQINYDLSSQVKIRYHKALWILVVKFIILSSINVIKISPT